MLIDTQTTAGDQVTIVRVFAYPSAFLDGAYRSVFLAYVPD